MASMKKDPINPGPKQNNNSKQKNLISPRGSVPSSKGKIGQDKQFNDGSSYDSDDGSGKTSSVNAYGKSKVSKVGSSSMGDEQFDSQLQDGKITTSGKLGSKSSGGKPGNFDGQNLSPAASIMREVAKASMKADQHPTKYSGNKDVSSPKSKTQTKSYKDTTKESVQSRPKTSVSQKFVEKAPESKKGSKS